MFYVKHVTDDVEVKIEIHDDNVFNMCPYCGAEVSVDLSDVFSDGIGDLYGTAVLCPTCSKKRVENAGDKDS